MTQYSGMPKPARARGKIAPVKLGHVAIRTKQLDAMLDYYGKLLEAEVAFRNESMGFITYDEEHHRLAIIQMPDLQPPPEKSTGLDHISFSFTTLGELLDTYKRLEALGIMPFWTIIHGPSTSMYYKDPDGNRVELMIDNFDSAEEIQAFFATGAYEENPMGIIFDPEEMIAKHKAGVPFKDIVKRPKLPEGMSWWDMLRT
ncbi:MAG: VOC family protein [Rhodospirillaceae bacterium]|nr:VOC family protein [Rhodospirillaceae bacterium]